MASKKKAWSDLLGTPPGAEHGPAEEATEGPPATALMHTLVGHAENPRPEDDYTDADPEFVELKATMREIGQLQPVAVVSRGVYEQAKPDAVAKLKQSDRERFRQADWVVVTGNRRLAAARQLGWTRIDIRVQDHLGDEDGRIDDAVIIENIHRKNIAPIKEAEFLVRMVDKHGSQEKVADRIGKSQMYISHRLSLLKLAPDLQRQVDAGELKLRDARQLASQADDHAEQRALAAGIKEKAAEPRPHRKTGKPTVQNPVLKHGAKGEPTPDSPAAGLPWGSPHRVSQIIRSHMTPENRATLIKLLSTEA